METTATPIPCSIPGVSALQRKYRSRVNSQRVEERLYTCANGLGLGMRRGGAYSDMDRWQMFTIDSRGIPITDGEAWPTPVFIDHDEARILRLVTNLSRWNEDAA